MNEDTDSPLKISSFDELLDQVPPPSPTKQVSSKLSPPISDVAANPEANFSPVAETAPPLQGPAITIPGDSEIIKGAEVDEFTEPGYGRDFEPSDERFLHCRSHYASKVS